jgi:hypothetical protein
MWYTEYIYKELSEVNTHWKLDHTKENSSYTEFIVAFDVYKRVYGTFGSIKDIEVVYIKKWVEKL